LDITDEIKESFKSLLEKQGVELEFSYGHWAGLSKELNRFDLVLTAETIYAEESVDDLLSVLKSASNRSVGVGSLENGMDKMPMQDKDNWTEDIRNETVILVAAKVSPPLIQSLTSGPIFRGGRRLISISTSSRTERRVVYDYKRVDAGSREEGSTDRLREGLRAKCRRSGGVESTMSPSFNPYPSIQPLIMAYASRSISSLLLIPPYSTYQDLAKEYG
jgi:hypothetical protein